MSSKRRASADHALRARAARFEHCAVPYSAQERIPAALWALAAPLSTVLPLVPGRPDLAPESRASKPTGPTTGTPGPSGAPIVLALSITPGSVGLGCPEAVGRGERPDGSQLRISRR